MNTIYLRQLFELKPLYSIIAALQAREADSSQPTPGPVLFTGVDADGNGVGVMLVPAGSSGAVQHPELGVTMFYPEVITTSRDLDEVGPFERRTLEGDLESAAKFGNITLKMADTYWTQ